MARTVNFKPIIGGAFFIAVGTMSVALSRDYDIGTALNMGPGYFPALLGFVLAGLGAGGVVSGLLARAADPIERHDIDPLITILIGILAFSFLVTRAGLFVAAAALIFFGCFRRVFTHPLEVLLIYVVLTGFSALVFVHWFEIAIPLFWWG